MFSISPDIIILGFVAGFILFRLFTVLGKHDDDGKIMPSQPINNIIDISATAKVEEIIDIAQENEIAPGFSETIEKIRIISPNFSVKKFYDGAKTAFEMILSAFASNDLETLNELLDKNTLKQFTNEINKRIQNKHTLDLTLVSIANLTIKNISLKDKIISIELLFESQQINLIKDSSGNIIEGDPSQIDNVEDSWTFAKNLTTGENWKLVQVNAN